MAAVYDEQLFFLSRFVSTNCTSTDNILLMVIPHKRTRFHRDTVVTASTSATATTMMPDSAGSSPEIRIFDLLSCSRSVEQSQEKGRGAKRTFMRPPNTQIPMNVWHCAATATMETVSINITSFIYSIVRAVCNSNPPHRGTTRERERAARRTEHCDTIPLQPPTQ